MRKRAFAGVWVGLSAGLASISGAAWGQSFNIDFDWPGGGGSWVGRPADAYSGAIDQAGYWYQAPFNPTLTNIPNLAGQPTSVDLYFGAASIYFTNIAGVSGNAALLLGDGLTSSTNQPVTVSLVGMTPGVYTVITYAADPYANDPCNVTVPGSIDGVESVSGGMNGNTLTRGVTHSKHRVVITGDLLRVQAADPSTNGVGRVAGLQIRFHGGLTTRLYVDSAVAVSGDGSSWSQAIKRLDDAMVAAELGDVATEIWVKGIHTPRNHDNVTDRAATFRLLNGVRIYGGFAGTETSLDQRDIAVHETILSGNIGGRPNDDNVYHVITADGVFSSAMVDGCTITGGYADGTGFQAGGGAVWIRDANPRFRRCTFRDNFALEGGAVSFFAAQSLARFTRCDFIDNAAQTFGGAIYFRGASGSQVAFGNCRFLGNTAGGYGGAVYALNGPGFSLFYNTVFSGNASTNLQGGAIYAFGSQNDTRLAHCTVSGNRASHGGGIVCNAGATVRIDNSIVWGNSDSDIGTSTFDEQIFSMGTTLLNSSDVQALPLNWPGRGPGCLSRNPVFMNPDGADAIFGTEDDDVSLAASSPCIDAADNGLIPSDLADVDLDNSLGEIVPIDLAGNSRRIDDPSVSDIGSGTAPLADMGAFEHIPCPADFNEDGFLDFFDYDDYVTCFETGACPPGRTADFNGDDFVDFFDYDAFVTAFSDGC